MVTSSAELVRGRLGTITSSAKRYARRTLTLRDVNALGQIGSTLSSGNASSCRCPGDLSCRGECARGLNGSMPRRSQPRYAGVLAEHREQVVLVREEYPRWGGPYWNIPSGRV